MDWLLSWYELMGRLGETQKMNKGRDGERLMIKSFLTMEYD